MSPNTLKSGLTVSEKKYLWSKVCQPQTTNQTDPLAQGLSLVEGKHGFPHLTAVADRNVRHEFHPSCHNSITLASSNETNSWKTNKAGENKQKNKINQEGR